MRKFLFFIIIFLNSNLVYSIDLESLSEVTSDIEKVQEKLGKLSSNDGEIAKTIDSAVDEINKATEFVKKSLKENNLDNAIKTIEFIENSLSDVSSLVPQELITDTSKIDMTQFDKEKIDTVLSITKNMNEKKEKKLNKLVSDMAEMQKEGLEVREINNNLQELGVKTIKIGVDLDKAEEMKTWSKEQWAESYEGAVITSAGKDVIVDKEIDSKILELENKLDQNNLKLLETRNNIKGLEKQLTPLNSQIISLSEKKKNLLDQYNSELSKLNLVGISDEEIAYSKEMSDRMSLDLAELDKQINLVENQTVNINQQVASLNSELSNEIAISNNINSKISKLNKEVQESINLLSNKSAELEQIKDLSPEISSANKILNERLQKSSLERDFIQTQFERSINKEVEHFQYYASVFSDDMSEAEIDFAFREVGALLDGDPRKSRAFEIEKYGTFAGLSQSEIQSGIDAALNDDWGTQKKVVKNIYSKLNKNPNWVVDVPSNAGLNVLIAEEQAIQEAVFVMNQSRKVRADVDKIINQRTAQYRDILSINQTDMAIEKASLYGKAKEYVDKEISNISSKNEKYQKLVKGISEKKTQIDKLIDLDQQRKEKIKKEISNVEKQMSSNLSEINQLQSDQNENSKKYFSQATKIVAEANAAIYGAGNTSGSSGGPTAEFDELPYDQQMALFDIIQGKADIETSEMKQIQNQIKNTQNKIAKLQNKFQQQSAKIMDIRLKGQTSQEDLKLQYDLQNQLKKATLEKISVESEINKQARANVINLKKNAFEEVNKIRAEEIAKTNGLYNTEEAVFNVLNEIPTFDDAQRKRASEVISGGYYRIGGGQIIDFDNKAAGLIAALDSDPNTYDAFKAAVDNVKKIGKTPAFKGHYWEMTNVKLAAIVHSKLNGNYDYMYINEEDKIQLSAAERAELKAGFSELYGSNNPKLNILNKEIDQINNQISLNNSKVVNVKQDITNLENEISALTSKRDIAYSKVESLSAELFSKRKIISEKKKSLDLLQSELDPISNKINKLKNQKSKINERLNNQLDKLAKQVESQNKNPSDVNEIKAKFESEISEIDNQLSEFQGKADKITDNIFSLNDDLKSLDKETPELVNQITKLNSELQVSIDIKADLAITQAKKANIEIEKKIVNSIAKLDNKSIIKIEGTNTLRIVDTDLLKDDSGKFKMPEGTMSVNGEIFTAGAVEPERLLSFESIDETGDLKVSYSKAAIDQITNTGKLAGGTQEYTGSSLGSWVLVDAASGKQMKNPLNGHQGSIVCEASTCGPEGSFGKQAASFGGIYVMENMVDPNTGNVAGRCAGGNCQFNFGKNIVSSISINTSQNQEISESAKANLDSARKVAQANTEATKNILSNTGGVSSEIIENLSKVASLGADNERLQKTIKEINASQAKAAQMIASSLGTNITNSLSTQTAADALAGQMARDMLQGASNQVNKTSQNLRQAQAALSSATTEAARAAAQQSVEAAQAASQAAQAAAQAAQEATQEIQQAAAAAQEAAGEAVAGISGNDLEALSQLANDALGVWYEVDSQGNKVGQGIVCTASVCGKGGSFANQAESRGNSYQRSNQTGGY